MLYIKYNVDGKAIYAIDNECSKSSSTLTDCVLVPHTILSKNTIRSKLKVEEWYVRNKKEIDDITHIFLEALEEFCVTNPQYICSVKENVFHSKLTETLYNCSHNAYKTYPL